MIQNGVASNARPREMEGDGPAEERRVDDKDQGHGEHDAGGEARGRRPRAR